MSVIKDIGSSVLPELFNGAQCGLIFTDQKDKTSLTDKKAGEIPGVEAEKLLGKPLDALLAPSTLDELS